MEQYFTRAEQEVFSALMKSENQRLTDENDRQNQRLKVLEENVQEISQLARATEKLAVNMENMLKVQEQQGTRLKALEAKDGEMWRKVTGYLITAAAGILLGFLFKQLGM